MTATCRRANAARTRALRGLEPAGRCDVKKIEIEELLRHCPGVDERIVAGHMCRLGADYFAAFTPVEIGRHVQAIAALDGACLADLPQTLAAR